MNQDSPVAAPVWRDSGDVHRGTYRVFCILTAVLNPLFGVVYQVTDPGGVDPIWGRLVMSVLLLLLLSLSYMVEWAADNFIVLVRGYFYLLILNLVGLTALNDFAPNYALGMLFAFTAMGVAFSLGLRKRIAPLKRYLVFVVLLVGAASFTGSSSDVSLWIVWACVASTALIIYVVAEAKVQTEEAADASEHRFHTLMNAASDAIIIADPGTGLLVEANEKALGLTGLAVGDVRRTRVSDLFPPESRERSTALFNAHVFEKQPIPVDLFVSNGAGGATAVDVSASLIDVDGRKFVQGIFRDVTERHRYEAQLIEAKERAEELLGVKTSLLNNMSHELRTPITAILGFSELLLEDVDEEQRSSVERILRGAERLCNTVDAVLGLAQLEAGASAARIRSIDVAPHLRESIALLQPLADRKGLGLRLDVRTTHAYAEADSTYLDQIVNNLVGNAIKFTDRGEVSVELSARGNRVLLRVQDTGIGIGEDFLPHLFEEFQQESTGLGRSHEGNGLGLTITKRLVDLLGGEITVESEKGVGSTFTVALPRAAAVPEREERRPPPLPPVTSTSHRVLVLEDNVDTREVIKRQIGVFCQVEAVSDPSMALALAEVQPFDAVLLDINLSTDRDGVDVLRALRAMPAYASVPAVAVTAYAMPGDRERFIEAGFDHYISKPFTAQDLRALVLDLFATPPENVPALAERPSAYLYA